jgi:nucleoside 2-deoxyribosyltransferase
MLKPAIFTTGFKKSERKVLMSKDDHQSRHRQQVYLAAPLFSEAERAYNIHVTELLEKFTGVYLPQRDGGLMSEMIDKGVQPAIAARHIFFKDLEAIRKADCLIAILDGRAIDEGVAFELGVAFSQSKRCVGLQTDSRRLAVWGNNPMITGALEIVFTSLIDLIEWIKLSGLVNRSMSHKIKQPVTV